MKIVFDARMFGRSFGIGVYISELGRRLGRPGGEHTLIFLVRPDMEEEAKAIFGDKVKVAKVDIPHYSWSEQFTLLKILRKLRADLVHFPNFNIPIFYKGRFIVTIHDLVHHKLPGHRRSHILKRLAYRLIMKQAVSRARAIIAVSRATKQDILAFFPSVRGEKIFVINEGVGRDFSPAELAGEAFMLRSQYKITAPYILFVGVKEVKKNLPFLVKVFVRLAKKYDALQLVLAGKDDPWHPEVGESIKKTAGRYYSRIIDTGFIRQEDLPAAYRQAALFVNPSTLEGFGLPALEAMACGTPVAVADTEVFREIYGDSALYFKADNEEKAFTVIDGVLSDEGLRQRMKTKGFEQAAKYTWEEAAARTISLYEQS